mmetsp:Transcript_42654/g.121028  ORF Transcript_42654/g.121028 Transcript_42654/m.121028 type:complete len:219 (+) Transcript_42654:498-1154(+)
MALKTASSADPSSSWLSPSSPLRISSSSFMASRASKESMPRAARKLVSISSCPSGAADLPPATVCRSCLTNMALRSSSEISVSSGGSFSPVSDSSSARSLSTEAAAAGAAGGGRLWCCLIAFRRCSCSSENFCSNALSRCSASISSSSSISASLNAPSSMSSGRKSSPPAAASLSSLWSARASPLGRLSAGASFCSASVSLAVSCLLVPAAERPRLCS